MSDRIIRIHESSPDVSSAERAAYDAVDTLFREHPDRIPALWWQVARAMYEWQPAGVIRDDGAIVCPHCGKSSTADLTPDGEDDYTSVVGVALQTEREYPGMANVDEGRIPVQPDEQPPDDWGLLLYLECSECDGTFSAPQGYELVRS